LPEEIPGILNTCADREAWYREGKDVQRLLPLLSTYLGHVDIASTQLYLTMTPALLHEASQRFAQYVFGEVSHG
jgi:hypothetical protein